LLPKPTLTNTGGGQINVTSPAVYEDDEALGAGELPDTVVGDPVPVEGVVPVGGFPPPGGSPCCTTAGGFAGGAAEVPGSEAGFPATEPDDTVTTI
jgi:hypothetical protein